MDIKLGSLKKFLPFGKKRVPRDVVVGIDFGSTNLNVVQISKKYDIPTLDTYGEIALGPFAGKEEGAPVPVDVELYLKALSSLAQSAGIDAKGAVLTIPFSATFTTPLTIPSLDEAEITAQIPVKIKDLIPVQLRDVTIDWFPIVRDKEKGQTQLLAVAVYNKTLKDMRQVAQQAGFTLLGVELEFFSMLRVQLKHTPAKPALLLDIGPNDARLYVTEANKLTYAGRIGRVTVEGVGQTVRSINSVIAAQNNPDTFVGAPIVLYGNVPAGLDTTLGNALERPCHIVDPVSHVAYPQVLQEMLKSQGARYAAAIGATFSILDTVE